MATKNETIIKAEPGKQELFITREFEAPRELVFKAFTTPELIVKWLGPKEMKMRIDYLEAKSGGKYRYIHTDPDGNDYSFQGVIREVRYPERVIQTFEFEGLPEAGHVTLETARFIELLGDRTRVIVQSIFQSVADRDGMVASGMECGVIDSHQRLDELFAQGLANI